MTICWKAVKRSALLWCCLLFNFTQFVNLGNLLILDLARSGVKGLNVCLKAEESNMPTLHTV